MVARDVMTEEVITVRAHDTVRRAAQIMLETGFAALPVLDANDTIVGLFSETDLLRMSIPDYLKSIEDLSFLPKDYELPTLASYNVDELTVADVMRTDILFTVEPDEPIIEVARIMVVNHVRRCAVVEAGKLVGIVTRRDLIELLVRLELEGDA